MQVHLLLWTVLTTLTGEGYISALAKHGDSAREGTNIPKIRHKSFSFNDDEDGESESDDAVEENRDIDNKVKVQHQLPKAQPSRSNVKPKSILEKLVREPELGKNPSLN